ncbi:DUF507 family protein [Candidatus Sumerlaeota bacterium]|nr:DUF507 family protein [Candidatus Sumerlaeota bacterium]
MRLSEERIEFIARQIAKSLMDKKYVSYYSRNRSLDNVIAREIMQDLSFEDKIDAEVEKSIRSIKRDIPEGSAEWMSIFQQKKEELAKRHNYIY